MFLNLTPAEIFVIGAGTLVFGIWQYLRKKKRLRTWIRTTATVENVRRDSEGDVTVRLKHLDQQGKVVASTVPVSDGDRIGLGSELDIAYDPASPEQAFLASKGDMSLAVIAWCVFGLGIMISAAIFYFTR